MSNLGAPVRKEPTIPLQGRRTLEDTAAIPANARDTVMQPGFRGHCYRPSRLVVAIQWMFSGLAEIAEDTATAFVTPAA